MTDAPPAWRHMPPRHLACGTRGRIVLACLTVGLLTMLASLLMGQDSNWDLRNYHLYSGWAVLHGRLSVDLAPAQLQSYFVPWLDAGYYLLAVQGSPMLAAAVLGALHGLAFAATWAVAWLALQGDARRPWLAPLLALAGCLGSAVFLAELGSSMGDNTIAPLIIGALALALHAARTDAARHWLLAGLVLGLGLKLTSAPYALGLGVAALAAGGRWTRRLRGAALMTAAAALVFALIAGPWFWQVYQQFGNPLFPQFNHWFHSPLAWSLPNSDTSWVPKKASHMLAWPLLFGVKPGHIGEGLLYQPAFGALYLLAALALVRAAWRRTGRGRAGLSAPDSTAARMLAIFVVVSFVAWMVLFSIHRYLVALELLAPLALWLLARHALPGTAAEKWAAALVAACAAAGSWGGMMMIRQNTWNHEPWARPGFTVETPPMEQPSTATVLLTGGEPQAWRIPFLPRQAVYIGSETSFPKSPGYDERMRQIAAERGGKVYVMFPGALEGAPCRCWLDQPDAQGADNQNRLLLGRYAHLRDYGSWQLIPESCSVHGSTIGLGNYPFHWCEVKRLP